MVTSLLPLRARLGNREHGPLPPAAHAAIMSIHYYILRTLAKFRGCSLPCLVDAAHHEFVATSYPLSSEL